MGKPYEGEIVFNFSHYSKDTLPLVLNFDKGELVKEVFMLDILQLSL